MAAGLEAAGQLVRRSLSEGTWAFYSRAWEEWESVLESVPEAKADFESGLLFFIGSQFGMGMSPSGMSRRLSALAFWFKLRQLADYTKSFLVQRAMRGFRRGQRVRDSRRPVSFDLLLSLGAGATEVCSSVYEARLFRASFSLAFFGAFRVSELVSPSRSRAGGLGIGDVRDTGDGLVCTIRRSKTDQRGRGLQVSLRRLPGSSMCPVLVVREFLAVRPVGDGPLLVHADQSFLSVYQFVQIFRRLLVRLGFSAAEFSSHSFRIGAATEAARWGLSPDAVKRIGRWESDRYRIYVRPQLLP